MFIRKCIVIVMFCFFMVNASQAQQTVLYDAEGHAVPLSQLKGKWIVLNYWADWCGACVQEIPELNRFYQTIQGKNIAFYGVDFDEMTLDNLKSSIASVSIHYPVLTSDPGYIWNLDSINVIPTTFIINPQGQVVKVITGPNTEKSLLNTINSLQSVTVSVK